MKVGCLKNHLNASAPCIYCCSARKSKWACGPIIRPFFLSWAPQKNQRGLRLAPLRPYKLMIQRVQFIEGSDSRNELLSDIYLVASPKRFSPHFHGQAKGLLLGPENFDGHAKLLSFKSRSLSPSAQTWVRRKNFPLRHFTIVSLQ